MKLARSSVGTHIPTVSNKVTRWMIQPIDPFGLSGSSGLLKWTMSPISYGLWITGTCFVLGETEFRMLIRTESVTAHHQSFHRTNLPSNQNEKNSFEIFASGAVSQTRQRDKGFKTNEIENGVRKTKRT